MEPFPTGIDNGNGQIQNSDGEARDRKNDLQELENMFRAILDLESDEVDVLGCVIRIGEAAGRISFNNWNDKGGQYIRNKYGFLRWGKSRTVRKEGIYFERLSSLVAFLNYIDSFSRGNSQFPEGSPTNCEHQAQTTREVFHLKHKLMNLKYSNYLRGSLSRLKQKLAHIFNQERHSIAHLSRDISANFGARIDELTDFRVRRHEQFTLGILKFEIGRLQPIDFNDKLDRYYFAHFFCSFGELLKDLMFDRDNFQNDGSLLMGKTSGPVEGSVRQAFTNLSQIRNQTCRNHERISNGVDGNNETITAIVSKIKAHFQEVILEGAFTYIINAHYDRADEFEKDTDDLLRYLFGKEGDAKLAEQIDNTGTVKSIRKGIETRNYLNKLVMKASTIMGSEEPFSEELVKKLKDVNKEYQLNIRNLNEEDKARYPSALHITNKEQIIEKEVNIKINKIVDTLEKIQKEFKHLRSLKEMTCKSGPVFEHSMRIIGLYISSIENVNICGNKMGKEYVKRLLPYLYEIDTSVLLKNAGKACKDLRVKGLGQDAMSFNNEYFYYRFPEITALHSYLDALKCIMKNENQTHSPKSFYKRALSFLTLGYDDQACEYANKGLEICYKDQPKKDKIPPSDPFDQEFREILGYPEYICRMHLFKIEYLFSKDQLEEVNLELDAIIKQIDWIKLEGCNNLKVRNAVSCFLRYKERYYNTKGKCYDAWKCLEKAETITQSSPMKYESVEMYSLLEEFDKDYDAFPNEDPHRNMYKYLLLNLLFKISLMKHVQEGVFESRHYIGLMKELLQTNMNDFKYEFGNVNLHFICCTIYNELELFIEENSQDIVEDIDVRLSKLKKIEFEFCDTLTKIGIGIKDYPQMVLISLNLCRSYCSFYNETYFGVHNNRIYLDSAQRYFDSAREHNLQFPDNYDRTTSPFEIAAFDLFESYYVYVSTIYDRLSVEERIECLKKVVELDKEFDFKKYFTNINDFKFEFNSKYFEFKFLVIILKLEFFIEEHLRDLGEDIGLDMPLLQLKEVEAEFSETLLALGINKKDYSQIKLICLYLCLSYCGFYSERYFRFHNKRKYLDSAQRYFDTAKEYLLRFPDLDLGQRSIFEIAASVLSESYNLYVSKTIDSLSLEERIECLKKVMELDNEFNLNMGFNFFHLGWLYCRLGRKYFDKRKADPSKEEYSVLELRNFEEGIKYCKLSIKEFMKENHSEEEIKNGILLYAFSIIRVTFLKYDLRSMENTISHFEELSHLPGRANLYFASLCKQMKVLFSEVVKVLEEIKQGASVDKCLSKASKYVVSYCEKKLNLRICYKGRQKKWTYILNSPEQLKDVVASELKGVKI